MAEQLVALALPTRIAALFPASRVYERCNSVPNFIADAANRAGRLPPGIGERPVEAFESEDK